MQIEAGRCGPTVQAPAAVGRHLSRVLQPMFGGDARLERALKNEDSSVPFDRERSRRSDFASVLHEAAAKDDTERAAGLLRRGVDANANAGDVAGEFPLHTAAEHGAVAVAAVLLNEGDACTSCEDIDGATPLHTAARRPNNSEMVSLLLRAGAEPDATDHRGNTPIHIAATAGQCDSVRALLDGPGVARATNRGGRRSRRGARAQSSEGTTAVYWEAGLAAARKRNRQGLTAVQLAQGAKGVGALGSWALIDAAECRGQLSEALRKVAAETADRQLWERRALAAEAELAKLRPEVEQLRKKSAERGEAVVGLAKKLVGVEADAARTGQELVERTVALAAAARTAQRERQNWHNIAVAYDDRMSAPPHRAPRRKR